MLFLYSKKILVVLFCLLQSNQITATDDHFNLIVQNKPQQQPTISLHFYKAQSSAQLAKNQLQSHLQNFLEHLQRNLTTSYIFNMNSLNEIQTTFKFQKILELSHFFEAGVFKVEQYAHEAETFFEASKQESLKMWQKLRQVPVGQRLPPMHLKQELTGYYMEMEFFHILFSELIDEMMEYTLNVLNDIQKTLGSFVGIQQELLQHWQANSTDECYRLYMSYLQHWSAQLFKCAADDVLLTVFDVYAVAEINIRYALQQLEYRLNLVFNCFFLGQFEMRCRFLQHAEEDFEKMRTKLDEWQVFFDIRAKHGLISTYIQRQQNSETKVTNNYENELILQDRCIPLGFPEVQMSRELTGCFAKKLVEENQLPVN